MSRLRLAYALVVCASTAGCAQRSARPAATPMTVASPAAPLAAQTLAACEQLVVAHHDLEAELRCLAGVETPTLKEETALVYLKVTALLYHHEAAKAEQAFAALLQKVVKLPGSERARSWLHNAQTWVAWSRGNYAGAIEENRLARVAVLSLPGEERRELMLHHWWDRAALLIEHAAVDPTADKLAEDARHEYRALAHVPDEHDGLAVLDAWFAYCRHDGAAARKAAETVNVEQDSDVQDLYIIALALDAGGAHDKAHALCERIAHSANEYPMKPIVLDKLHDCR